MHFEGKNVSRNLGCSPAGERIIHIRTENLYLHYSVSCIVSLFDPVPTFCDYHTDSNDQVIYLIIVLIHRMIFGTLFTKLFIQNIYSQKIYWFVIMQQFMLVLKSLMLFKNFLICIILSSVFFLHIPLRFLLILLIAYSLIPVNWSLDLLNVTFEIIEIPTYL